MSSRQAKRSPPRAAESSSEFERALHVFSDRVKISERLVVVPAAQDKRVVFYRVVKVVALFPHQQKAEGKIAESACRTQNIVLDLQRIVQRF